MFYILTPDDMPTVLYASASIADVATETEHALLERPGVVVVNDANASAVLCAAPGIVVACGTADVDAMRRDGILPAS